MTSLREMHERLTQWQAERPNFSGGDEIRFMRDDLAIFQFASSGEDGDQLIKIYRSHVLEAISKTGSKYNTHRYCPVQSGEDIACPLCDQDIKTVKERMSIWMWVTDIMHKTLPQDKQYPYVEYEGSRFYREEVNAWRIWHTSAWRDSCWPDIIKLYSIYNGLHNFTAQLLCSGDGVGRRYKVFALPNSPALTPEMYARAKEECEAIPAILKRQMNSPVQANPQASPVGQAQPQQEAAPFSPFQPAAIPFTAPSADKPQPVDPPPSAPEGDTRRPLKSLF
jgi:hypothetical protein